MRRRIVRTVVVVGAVVLVPLVTSADSIPHAIGTNAMPGGSLGQSVSGRHHSLGADRTSQHSVQSPGALDWSEGGGHDVYFFSGANNDTSPTVDAWNFAGVTPAGGNERGFSQTGAGEFPSAFDSGEASFRMPGGAPWVGWRARDVGIFGAFGGAPAGADYAAYAVPFFSGGPGAPTGSGATPGSNAVSSGGQGPSAGDPGNGSPGLSPGSPTLSPSSGGEPQSSSPNGGPTGAPPIAGPSDAVTPSGVATPSGVTPPTNLFSPSNLVIPDDVVIPDDATPAKVPEPGSLALLATALLGLGFVGYFRRRRSA